MPVISTNIAANSAVRYLNVNSADQTSSLSKLASGSRISQASDDAAGLAISTRITSDVTTLTQAATNASHGISVLQTADGGAANISDILQRMKALASQSASGTVTDNERAYIDAEFSQLTEEIDGISESTRYNGQSLLDGSSAFADGITVMVGSDASDTITVSIAELTASALGITAEADEAAADLVGGSAGITVAATTAAVPATAATLTGGALTSVDAAAASVAASGATLAGGALTGVDASGGDMTFDVSGTTVTLSATGGTNSDGVYSADDIASAINTALTAASSTITVAADSTTGALTFTDSTTGAASEITIDNFTGGLDATGLGLTATTAAGNDATEASFDVNGTTVTLSATGGTNSDGVYSAQEIADAINTALSAVTGNTITASADATTGALTFTDSATGAASEITIDGFQGVTATDLGLTATTAAGTDEVPAGAGTASFSVNGTTVSLSSTGGTNADGVYSAEDIASAINTALSAVTGNTVTAEVDATSGALTLSNSATGSDASITLAGFTGLEAEDLGFTETSSTGRDEGDTLSVATQDGANAALEALDEAINLVSKARADIGATESRFAFRSESIATSIENLSAANSALQDVDVASESAKLASAKVKTQAAVAAASQASQMPQDLLKLLQ